MKQDLVLAFRQWRAHPGFALVTLLTLALGIGGNTAIFSLVHAILLKSLPVADPQQLYRLGDREACCAISGLQTRFSIFSNDLYQRLRAGTPEFAEMAAAEADRLPLSVRGHGAEFAETFTGELVSANYFAAFGIRAWAGRVFQGADDQPGAPPVAVISHHAWEQHYSQDASAIGSTASINGIAVTIAGVAPPGFFGERLGIDEPDFWLPLGAEPRLHGKNALLYHPDQHWLYLIGRLRPGARAAEAEARLNVELKQWWAAQPLPPGGTADAQAMARQHIALTPAGRGIGGMKSEYADALRILTIASGLVLLIACANIANLLLARGMNARAQTSIRLALGAQRPRLVRQALTESIALALAGGALGAVFAWAGTRGLLALAFRGAAYVPIDPRPSALVLAFTFLLSLATGMLFGMLPAWISARFDPIDALRGAGRSSAGGRAWPQRSLVVLQSALSLVLLTGAGLLTKSLGNLENQQYGFAAQDRVVVRVSPSFVGYTPERLYTVYERLRQRLAELPGVRSSSFALYSPMRGGAWSSGIAIEGRTQPAGRGFSSMWDRVAPHYFETVGTPLVRGRAIDESDTPSSRRVAVVNRAFAERYFAGEDPLGKRFRYREGPGADYEIVGVAENARYAMPREPVGPMFFLPYLQMEAGEWADSARARSNYVQDIVLRLDGAAAGLDVEIRRALQNVDPNLSVIRITTFGEQLARNFTRERLIARLTGIFSLLALALACLGLYGVTAYVAAQRTAEIGIRTALGAPRAKVVGLVLGGAMGQIACAAAIGIPASRMAARLLESQVYGVAAGDPASLAEAVLLLFVCALIAGWIPAHRASRVDPMRALRAE